MCRFSRTGGFLYIDWFQNNFESDFQILVGRTQINSIQNIYNFNLAGLQKLKYVASVYLYHQDKMSNVSTLGTPKYGQFLVQINTGIGLFWDI